MTSFTGSQPEYLNRFSTSPSSTPSGNSPSANNYLANLTPPPKNSNNSIFIFFTLALIILLGLGIVGIVLLTNNKKTQEKNTWSTSYKPSLPQENINNSDNCLPWPGDNQKSNKLENSDTPFGLVASYQYAYYFLHDANKIVSYLDPSIKTKEGNPITAQSIRNIFRTPQFKSIVPTNIYSICTTELTNKNSEVKVQSVLHIPNRPELIVTLSVKVVKVKDKLKIYQVKYLS